MALDYGRLETAIVAGIARPALANTIAADLAAAYRDAPEGSKPTGAANIQALLDRLVPEIAKAVAKAVYDEITGHAEVSLTITAANTGLQTSASPGSPTGGPAAPVDIGGAGFSSVS